MSRLTPWPCASDSAASRAIQLCRQVRHAGIGVRLDQVRGNGQQQVEGRGTLARILADRLGVRLVAEPLLEQVADRDDERVAGRGNLRPAKQLARLADLVALVEALATDGVRDAGPRQLVLDRRQLRVDADEDSDLRLLRSGTHQPPDACDERRDLHLWSGESVDRGLGAGRSSR